MVNYFPETMGLTPKSARSLVKGENTSIPHKHLMGEHKVFLKAGQIKKLHAHRAGGKKGVMLLKFSRAQVRHHLKHGGGLWDKLKEFATPYIKPLINKGLEKLAEVAKPHVGALIGSAAAKLGKYIGHDNAATLAKHAQELTNKGATKLKGAINNKLTEKGYGIKNSGYGIRGGKVKRKYTKRKGKGVVGPNTSIHAVAKKAIRQGP